MYLNKILTLFVIILTLSIPALSEESHDEHEDHKEHVETSENHSEHTEKTKTDDQEEHDEHEEGVIKLSEKEINNFGIIVEKVNSGAISKQVELNGEIQINAENVTHISARFGGEIKEVLVRQGQFVKQGSILAKVQNSNNLTLYSVIAGRSGYVFFKDAAIGEIVDSSKLLFQLIDFSTVWANFGVYQKDMAKIKNGQTIKVLDPFSGQSTEGKITYVSPVMEEENRTVSIRTTLKNSKNIWKPGVFVTGFVQTDSKRVPIRIARSAVHNVNGDQVVFIQDEDGFEIRPVILGKGNEEFVQVISGIKKGDSIVTQNGFILKSELGKSEMSDGHNH